ncbi:MAG: hypothetical protein AAB874_06815 [Patescibacteria group bacterium]
MQKKNLILFLLLSIFVYPKFQVPIYAQTQDAYFNLEPLQVGDTLSDELKGLGKLEPSWGTTDPEQIIYSFTSSVYSNPHVVRLKMGKIIYIQLTIPAADLSRHSEELQKMGEPELKLNKVETEVLWSYPTLGKAYVLSGDNGQIMRVQKFVPKDVDAFIQNEGRNFQPVKNVREEMQVSGVPEKVTGPNLLNQLNPKYLTFGIIFIIISCTLIIWLWKFRQR